MFTNAQVADLVRKLDGRLARVERALAALPAPVASTPTVAPTVAEPVVAEPVLAIAERGAKVASARLTCVAHGAEGAGKACAREFRTQDNLDQHNSWAHIA